MGRLVTLVAALSVILTAGCSPDAVVVPAPGAGIRHVLLVTIDTLRADRLGAYGYARARTPAIDGLAARGVRFDLAFATAPITLPSHASLMTGRYPPGHASRHNGMKLDERVPTLAARLRSAGFATAAFVGAFPLDRRYGLDRGFDVYGDRMPRGADGRPANERAGQVVVDEALVWLGTHRAERTFLWVHLFEPHAPYGDSGDGRPAADRYDEEVAEADRQVGRLLAARGDDLDATLAVIAADHGEAFGEHGEIGHSVFVYDTTLRVPLVVAVPGLRPRVVDTPVSLVDVAPTIAALAAAPPLAGDGADLAPLLHGGTLPARALYAESFAPLLDFGWSPLRTVRLNGLKFIAAPRPELYEVRTDPQEAANLMAAAPARARELAAAVERISPASLDSARVLDPDAARRLQALGYAAGARRATDTLADPKDRLDVAARLAQVTSGELTGPALEAALARILADDPGNPQAHLRLGYVLAQSNRCGEAERQFRAVIDARTPTADAHLGLAGCLAARRAFSEASAVLDEALRLEPGNPVVVANQGMLLSDAGRLELAIPLLRRALDLDADLHQARFGLAIALARTGDRAAALQQADDLLTRLPPAAPQRPEVERLRLALQ